MGLLIEWRLKDVVRRLLLHGTEDVPPIAQEDSQMIVGQLNLQKVANGEDAALSLRDPIVLVHIEQLRIPFMSFPSRASCSFMFFIALLFSPAKLRERERIRNFHVERWERAATV